MASSLGSLVLELSVDVARFSSDLGKAEHLAQSYARKVSGIFKSVTGALGIGLGAVGVGEIFRHALDRAKEAEQASNRLSAVLKATGGAAGFAKVELDKMADAMARTTQFDDESIRNAAASLLIFKNIQGQTFTETLKLSADVAAFFGMDLPQAAAKLGKSLEDPETAFGLLKRAGVVLTEQQKSQIKTMGDLGDKAGQQAVVLKRLQEAFGGTAGAMNTGLTKASADLKKAWDELLESFGRTNVVKNVAEGSLFSVAGALEFLKQKLDDYNESTRRMMALRAGLPGQLEPLNPAPAFVGAVPGGVRIIRDREQSAAFDFEQAKKAAEQAKKSAANFDELMAKQQMTILKQQDDLTTQATENFIKHKKEEEEIQAKITAGWVAYAEAVVNADFETSRALAEIEIKKQNEEMQKANRTARELGLSFTSAFEDAVVAGKKLSDVLKGLAQDITRIAFRKTVTEPLGNMATDFFGGFLKTGIGSLFGGGGGEIDSAIGGPVSAGSVHRVGEHGMELFVPPSAGTIIPNHALGGGEAVTINFNVNTFDSRSFQQGMAENRRVIEGVVEQAFNRSGRRSGMALG